MRKKPMNFRLILALDGLALLAIIGAVQVVRWACSLMAVALTYWGGWDIAEVCACRTLDYCCIHCRADNVILWDA